MTYSCPVRVKVRSTYDALRQSDPAWDRSLRKIGIEKAQGMSWATRKSGLYFRAAGVSVASLRWPSRMYTTLAGSPIFSASSAYV